MIPETEGDRDVVNPPIVIPEHSLFTGDGGSALQTGLEEENPFAAYVLAQRYLSSGSERDRKEAMDILIRARSIAESNLEENDRPGLRSLLVEILQLLGKTCIAITNLPPRPMMGIDSCGMLISAVHSEEGEERLHLLMVDPHIPAGAKLY